MDYYKIKIGNLSRDLPIVAVSSNLKIASFNLLGDRELVVLLSKKLAPKIKDLDFDILVGPEVKVVPLLHELSGILGKRRYVICRKKIHGYMALPVVSVKKPSLVVDGADAKILKGKKVVVVDDVVSSGRTLGVMGELMERIGAKVVAYVTVFKQGEGVGREIDNLIYLGTLPLFRTS